MSIDSNTSEKIKHYLIDVIRKKLEKYNLETKEELLDIFEESGNILRPEIDKKFSQFGG